ncbi:MAG: hypothetical protein Q8L86_18995 [Vicinamibacterales bacterium]|nr:hypothetical protein [Vicinamibacterales bacterium]
MTHSDPLLAPMTNTDRREVAGVQMDVAPAGTGRIKRVVYPAGFRWSTHMQPIVGTERCMHAHVGFLARGQVHVEYPDGCTEEFLAPQVITIHPGHDAWVVGDEPAVLIEVDFEAETPQLFGLNGHRHRT